MNSFSLPLTGVIFGSPWLLAGLLFAGIPILIHLLHKRQFQETSWAAMRFLLAATRRNSRRLQLQQLILLAIRTLAIVLLVFALARPFFESSVVRTPVSQPTHRVLVIDASCSMRRTENSESLFDRAQRVIQSIVESSVRGDAIQLVRICDQSNRIIVSQPAWEPQIVADEVRRLEPTWETGQVSNALEDVGRLLETVGELDRKQVCIVSDFQSANWAPVGAGAMAIQESLRAISEKADLRVFNVGLPGVSNVAVTGCRANSGPAIAGQPIRVTASLRRWGQIQQTVAEFVVNDRELSAQTVEFSDSDTVEVTFEHIFSDAGYYDVRVRTTADEFSPDDQRWSTLEVLDSINTLLVNGHQSGRPMGNAVDFVKLSLVPTESPLPVGPIRVRVITDGELMSVDPHKYKCVFLCNVGLFTDQEADFLTRYARSGGGVVFLTGDQVRADVWNRVLYRDGDGILPAELMGRVGNAVDPKQVFVFNTNDLDHPLVSDYRGNPGFGLENVLTFEYFKARISDSESARSVLSFENGDPCVVESRPGNGHVLLLTTSGDDRRWCTWNTIGGTFAALINEITRYMAGSANTDVIVGNPLLVPLVEQPGADLTIDSPDGSETPVTVASTDDYRFTFRETLTPGIYRVRDASQAEQDVFAVNVDQIEGDIDVLDEDTIRDDLMNGIELSYETDYRQQTDSGRSRAQSTGPLVRWLLWCVAALLLVEQLMAWRFSFGLGLLAVFVATAFALRALTTGFWLGLVCVVVLCVVVIAAIRVQRASR